MLEFSSTRPDAFDTKKIAYAKWNQIVNGDKKAVLVPNSTIGFSQTYNEAYDTKVITVEKRLQTLN